MPTSRKLVGIFNLYSVKQSSEHSRYYNQKYGRKGLLFPFCIGK